VADERISLLLDMGVSKENVQAVVDKLDHLDAAAKKASGGVAGMGQSMLQTGRIIQDFSQGGIGGILNNIEGLVQSLGMGPGLAGALTVAGVAFALLAPKIKAAWDELSGGGSNPVPKARDHVKALSDELSTATKELDKLKEKQSLSNDELARFNTLTANAAILQKQVTDAKKRDAEFEQLRQQKGDEQKEAAGELAAYVGGDIDKLRGEVTAGVTKAGMTVGSPGSLGDLYKQLHATMSVGGEGSGRRADAIRARIAAERARLAGEADKAVSYMMGGGAGGVENVLPYLPEGSRFRRDLGQYTAGARRAQDEDVARSEAEGEAVHTQRAAARRARAAAAKQARAEGKVEALYEQFDAAGDAAERRSRQQRTREAHEIGERALRAGPPKLGKLAQMPENASPAEMMAIMAQNQEVMAQNQRQDAANVRQIQQSLRRTSRVLWDRKQTSANAGTAE
jgi:hypothetical protein